MSESPDVCPHCQASLVGEPIPEKDQHLFGATHFNRAIGVSNGDSVIYYRCPDCSKKIDRFDKAFRSGSHRLRGGHYPVRGLCGACQEGRLADCSGWCSNYLAGKT